MCKVLLGLFCSLAFVASVFVAAQAGAQHVNLRLRLVDIATGKGAAGIVRIDGPDQKPIELVGLFDRLLGLKKETKGISWYVVPTDGASITLPRAKLEVQALSGLETALTSQKLDLTVNTPQEVILRLT